MSTDSTAYTFVILIFGSFFLCLGLHLVVKALQFGIRKYKIYRRWSRARKAVEERSQRIFDQLDVSGFSPEAIVELLSCDRKQAIPLVGKEVFRKIDDLSVRYIVFDRTRYENIVRNVKSIDLTRRELAFQDFSQLMVEEQLRYSEDVSYRGNVNEIIHYVNEDLN